MGEVPDHVARNREAWDRFAADYAASGERNWAAAEPSWGIWDVPESEARLLPDDLAGRDAVELGCGTAYVSTWLARRGARPVGVDTSPRQLETARRLQAEHGLRFPLHLGNAEATPFADAGFDVAISEDGASVWCEPRRWVAEAARLLRPGGELVFLVNGLLLTLCTPEDPARVDDPVTERLERPLFGLGRIAWPDGSVELQESHGAWVRLLRANGLEILDLIELRPPAGATTSHPFVTLDWARRWPSEEDGVTTDGWRLATRHPGALGVGWVLPVLRPPLPPGERGGRGRGRPRHPASRQPSAASPVYISSGAAMPRRSRPLARARRAAATRASRAVRVGSSDCRTGQAW